MKLAPWCGDLPQIPDQRPLRCDATGWYTPQTVGNTCRNNAHSPKRTDGIHQFSMQWKVSWLVLHQMAVIKEKCRITCGEPQSKKKKRLTATAFGAELTWLVTYLHIWFRSSHPEDFRGCKDRSMGALVTLHLCQHKTSVTDVLDWSRWSNSPTFGHFGHLLEGETY